MKAKLKAPVRVWDIAIFAEIAIWESRPDLQALCAFARDRGGLDDDAIGSILPGLTARGRQNLRRHLTYIQLSDHRGSLTAFGERCASTGEAPAWEQGVYDLLVAVHPLFGSHLLDFKRSPTDAFDREYDDLKPLPPWLSPSLDRVFTSAFDSGRRFSVAAFPSPRGQDPTCRGWELPPGSLIWDLDLASGANQWTVEGTTGADNSAAFQSPPESVNPQELTGLYADWEPLWDRRLGRVLMPYDGEVGAGGRESFLRSWEYDDVSMGRFGDFNGVLVEDVPVGPATTADARIWATAIALARAEAGAGYVEPAKWRACWAAAVDGTPLSDQAGDLPAQADLMTVNGQRIAPRTRWLLSAAADLGMEE